MAGILQGKVAVVTGSGQGIGRGIALGLGKEGAKVVTNNRQPGSTRFALLSQKEIDALSPERRKTVFRLQEEYSGDAETTAAHIRELGGEAVAFFGDISKFEVAAKLVQKAVDTYGKIDILVNVAGTFGFSKIWEMSEELWDHVTTVKPKGYFNTIRHAVPFMMKQKWGRILNCTSQSWAGDGLDHAEYAAANAGVVGLTRAVASELFPYGITCNAFSPWARTRASYELEAYNLASGKKDDRPYLTDRGSMLLNTPKPDELGPVVAYLASDETANVSGSVFSIGGASVSLFTDPDIKRSISKFDSPWTIEELKQQIPRVLLAGYQPRVVKRS
jgi:3-oxoacyl-[acyl-carrier protein] reductase